MKPLPKAEIAPLYWISKIIKGGWHLAGGHGEIDRVKAIEDMAAFVESGITTFDCADIYTGVEELIGDFRRAYPDLAKRVQVHTKFVPDYDQLQAVEPAYIESIIDRSRSRLGVEALDLVQFHWWDTNVKKYVQTALELKRLQDAGKIRHIGLTNFNTACTKEILQAGAPIVSTQIQYSILDDRPSRELADYCVQNNIALLCYGSLAGGFLSGDWLGKPEPTGPFENRSHTKYKLMIDDFGSWSLFQELLETLQSIASQHGSSIGQIASSWTLHQPGAAAVIVGATSTRHLTETLRIPAIQLSSDDLAAIRRVADQRSGPKGDVYDLERDKDGRHGRIMKYNLNEDKA
jgi:aryl-alcohol dehydrogenase-like predicted oxidoreductase